MAEVLNPALYRKLKHLYGAVRVRNEGEAFVARATRGLEDEPLLDIQQSGEQYAICCPFCTDTRFRLYVSHVFGRRDVHGRRMTFLALCHNENCLAKGDNMQRFLERIDATDWLEDAPIRKGHIIPEEAREVQWPGYCVSLSRLKPTHKANAYLASRAFDPEELAETYKVCYCEESHYYLAQNRIIIPVFEGDKLKGWQARYVGELPWKDKEKKHDLPPKYFTCPNSKFRSRCIYNWDRMKKWQTGVVVEGPSDVWRFGAMSGCIFGNTITPFQKRKLLAMFRQRTLVHLLDPEEFESKSTQRDIRYFKARMPKHFAAVCLPEGTDPGSLGRDFLKDYVKEEAAAQGVKVVYKKVS